MKPSPFHSARRHGSAMLTILIVLATLSSCILAAVSFTSQTNRNVERSNALRRGLEIGDGAMEYAFAHWRETCSAEPNIQLPSTSFSSIAPPPTPPDVPDAAPIQYTLANFKVLAADQNWKPLASASATPVPSHGMSPSSFNTHYLASLDLTMPALGANPISVKLRRVFTKSQLSPWNYAIFYADDLEHHPGAPSVINGWVHTNGKLYTASNQLEYESKVSYGDDWEKNYKPGDGRRTGTTQAGPQWEQTIPPFRDQGQQPFGLDSSRIFSGGTSTNDDSYRELIERPGTGADPVAEARYFNQADIKVLIDGAGIMTITRGDNRVVSAASVDPVDQLVFEAVNAAVSQGTSITDKRENAIVDLVDVDVQKLVDGLLEPGLPPFNGIVYVSDSNGSSTVKRGVRLKNGATIKRKAGLTIASDNGIYVQGDYNTGRAGTTEPPSNKGNEAKPFVAGYEPKPAAVIADAVTILSNNWDDAKSSEKLTNRAAIPTTMNAAIVSGIVATTNGNYSGGAENFPRFLENWNKKDFTYYGSMVQLYQSEQFNTPWKNTGTGPNVYNPPNRLWFFDTRFYTAPPPGSLKLVSYNKGRWFREE